MLTFGARSSGRTGRRKFAMFCAIRCLCGRRDSSSVMIFAIAACHATESAVVTSTALGNWRLSVRYGLMISPITWLSAQGSFWISKKRLSKPFNSRTSQRTSFSWYAMAGPLSSVWSLFQSDTARAWMLFCGLNGCTAHCLSLYVEQKSVSSTTMPFCPASARNSFRRARYSGLNRSRSNLLPPPA